MQKSKQTRQFSLIAGILLAVFLLMSIITLLWRKLMYPVIISWTTYVYWVLILASAVLCFLEQPYGALGALGATAVLRIIILIRGILGGTTGIYTFISVLLFLAFALAAAAVLLAVLRIKAAPFLGYGAAALCLIEEIIYWSQNTALRALREFQITVFLRNVPTLLGSILAGLALTAAFVCVALWCKAMLEAAQRSLYAGSYYGQQPRQPYPPQYGQQPQQPYPPQYGQQPQQPYPPQGPGNGGPNGPV